MPKYYYDDEFPQYVSVGERRRKAERHAARLQSASPIVISGTQIAKTFWGKSWCLNLERYSDFANRLPRGRTYVRSGCVVDLRINVGKVSALVSGSNLYKIEINISALSKRRWSEVCHDCAGAIDSLVELLEGRFSKTTMERLCRQKTGLFPMPAEMEFSCSCPDSARMCKHVAAVLYGVGARLDASPELLFKLREVDQQDLVTNASRRMTMPVTERLLDTENLSELFGIEIAVPKRKRRKSSSRL
jgi:uncharacterized Zn finger protein